MTIFLSLKSEMKCGVPADGVLLFVFSRTEDYVRCFKK